MKKLYFPKCIDDLVQDCSISSALAMKIQQSYTKTLVYFSKSSKKYDN